MFKGPINLGKIFNIFDTASNKNCSPHSRFVSVTLKLPCNCRVIDGVWPHYPCGHSKRSLSASTYQGCMGGHIRANERRKLRAAGAASQAGARRATARPRATALAALLRQPRLTVSQQPPRNGRGVWAAKGFTSGTYSAQPARPAKQASVELQPAALPSSQYKISKIQARLGKRLSRPH